MKSSGESRYKDSFNDPEWKYQWYMHDYRAPGQRYPVMDLNVVPVHRMGFTGQGVTVAVVDDGVDHEHVDLAPNMNLELSYDMLANIDGSQPREFCLPGHKGHGTMVAGIIAMVANNSECGAGIAYNAKIASIRLLGAKHTERQFHDSLIKNLEHIDIYTSSFGSAHGPDALEEAWFYLDAIDEGIKEGRNKKGAIYVFGSGNGKDGDDNCATDKSVNHPFAIPIAAATQHGKTTPYSERCAAVMATAYSGGYTDTTEGIASTKMFGGCTREFSGTSASVPIATGIIALTLQANKELTYRDVMHLIAVTAEVAPLADNPGSWKKNAAGFWISNDFGFGLLNAENMVLKALEWTNVPEPKICALDVKMKNKPLKIKNKYKDYLSTFDARQPAMIEFDTDACQDVAGEGVHFLEKVELWSSIKYSYRGALSITVTSPKGTKSTLLEPREQDTSRSGFSHWRITSVQSWGENPRGTWIIEVKVNFQKPTKKAVTDTLIEVFKPLIFTMPNFHDTGIVYWMQLILRGTEDPPAYSKDLPRTYTGFRLADSKVA